MRKRLVGHLQNLAILFLTLSAVFLLIIVIPLELEGENGLKKIERLLYTEQAPTAQSSDLSTIAAPLNLVLTNDYGRRGEIMTTSLSDTAVQCGSLIREAMGSATGMSAASAPDFQESLNVQNIFMDFLSAMPAEIIAGLFGADFSESCQARCLTLSAAGEDTCTLFLWDGGEQFLRFGTAIPISALQEYLSSVSTNDAKFAFAAGEEYAGLYPYTILPAGRISVNPLTVSTPSEAVSDKHLLSVLGFNVHTNYRYPESNGTQVIVEYPRELRIQPDGTVLYSGDTESTPELFIASPGADQITASDAALTALRLAEEIIPPSFSGNAAFFLSHLEENEQGWNISLDVAVDGMPIYHSSGTSAAEFQFTGSTVTSFSIRCRQYLLSDQTISLLPVTQAAAVAGNSRNAMLTVAYVDRGGESASPFWMLR